MKDKTEHMVIGEVIYRRRNGETLYVSQEQAANTINLLQEELEETKKALALALGPVH